MGPDRDDDAAVPDQRVPHLQGRGQDLVGEGLRAREVAVEDGRERASPRCSPLQRRLANARGGSAADGEVAVEALAIGEGDRRRGCRRRGDRERDRVVESSRDFQGFVSPLQVVGIRSIRKRQQTDEGRDERSWIIEASGNRQGFVGDGTPSSQVVVERELGHERREETGAMRGVLGAHGCERGLEHSHALRIHRSGDARPAATVGERSGHEQLGVAERPCLARGGEQRLTMGRIRGLTLGIAQADEQRRVEPWVGAVRPVQLQGLRVPPHALIRCQLPQRAIAGLSGVADRLVGIVGHESLGPMVRELADAGIAVGADARLERKSDASVRAAAPARSEIFVQGVLHQGVREPVAIQPDVVDQGRRDRGVQHVQRFVFFHVRDLGQQTEVEVTTDHRRGPQQTLGVGTEPRRRVRRRLGAR